MNESKSLIDIRKRFCKDKGLSFNVFEGTAFVSRLHLFGAYDDYRAYEKMIEDRFHGNNEEFLAYYNKVTDKIMDAVKSSPAYLQLNSADMKDFDVICNYPDSDIYHTCNVGKTFISIDMRKANYTSLVYYSKMNQTEFVNDKIGYDYEAFIGQFTDIDILKKSKHLRQWVFGHCSSKRQIKYEKYMICSFLEKLFELGVPKDKVSRIHSDEIILDDIEDELLRESIISLCENNNYPVKYKRFYLKKIEGEDGSNRGFIEYDSDTNKILDLKCVHPDDYPFVIRLLMNDEPGEDDFVFTSNGRLAKYLEEPELYIIS